MNWRVFDKHLQLGILVLAKTLENQLGSGASRKYHSQKSNKDESNRRAWVIDFGGSRSRVEEEPNTPLQFKGWVVFNLEV